MGSPGSPPGISIGTTDHKNLKNTDVSLAALGQISAAEEVTLEPAVSVPASVKPDLLVCLDCGAKMKMIKRHLNTDHGLTPAEYRSRWNLNSNYPMVAPDYAAKRKELAVKIGLGRKPKVASGAVARSESNDGAPRKGKAAPAADQPAVKRGR